MYLFLMILLFLNHFRWLQSTTAESMQILFPLFLWKQLNSDVGLQLWCVMNLLSITDLVLLNICALVAMVWMPHPQLICWILTPKVMVLECMPLRSSVFMNGINALIKEVPYRSFTLPLYENTERKCQLWTRKKALTGIQPYWCLDLDLSAYRNERNNFFYCL